MTSTSQQLNELKRRLRSLEARQRGREANTLIFTAVGEAVMFGCKVTEGPDNTDMSVALEGQAGGDADNHNPDSVDPPVRAFEYPNIASLKGGAYLSQDDEAETEPAPATGTARYDIAYIFAGQSGPGFAIAQGAPSSDVKDDFDLNGLDDSDHPSQFDPDLPVGAFPVARIYVEDVYTGIQDARIADIRYISITRQVIQEFDQVLNTDSDVTFNSVDASEYRKNGDFLLTQSSTDTTAGRVIKTADYNLGMLTVNYASSVADFEAPKPAYVVASSGADRSPYGVLGSGWRMPYNEADNRYGEIYVSQGNDGDLYHRVISNAFLSGPIRRHYDTHNVVGTVSETGGEPTGAVIERGSNDDGEYIKYADGTQISWIRDAIDESIPADTSVSYQLVLPASYTGLLSQSTNVRSETSTSGVNVAATYLRGAAIATDSGALYVGLYNGNTSSVTSRLDVTVYGRWY